MDINTKIYEDNIKETLLKIRDHKRDATKWFYAGIICVLATLPLLVFIEQPFLGVTIILCAPCTIGFFSIVMLIENYWDWRDKKIDLDKKLQKIANEYIESINKKEF